MCLLEQEKKIREKYKSTIFQIQSLFFENFIKLRQTEVINHLLRPHLKMPKDFA